MKTEAFSLDHVDPMIDFFDRHIAANTDTPAMHDALQQRVDGIAAVCQEHPKFAEFYSRLLELQALIHGRRNQDGKAVEFMKEAVRQAGSVRGLKSKTLQQYIASHAPAKAAPASAQASIQQAAPAIAGRPAAQALEQAQVPVQPVQAAPVELDQPQVAQRKRRFNPFSKMKVGFAVILAVSALAGGTLYFVPRASAVPIMLAKYSEIQADKKAYQDLTVQYQACSAKLAGERGNVDTYDTQAVATFNQDTANCQKILHQQEQAANKYDSLIAAE